MVNSLIIFPGCWAIRCFPSPPLCGHFSLTEDVQPGGMGIISVLSDYGVWGFCCASTGSASVSEYLLGTPPEVLEKQLTWDAPRHRGVFDLGKSVSKMRAAVEAAFLREELTEEDARGLYTGLEVLEADEEMQTRDLFECHFGCFKLLADFYGKDLPGAMFLHPYSQAVEGFFRDWLI